MTREYVLVCPSLAIGGLPPTALSQSLCDSGNSMNIMQLILFILSLLVRNAMRFALGEPGMR